MEKDKTENHRGKYMNLLTMEHVSKAYTDRVLLDDVGFGINKNEKICDNIIEMLFICLKTNLKTKFFL